MPFIQLQFRRDTSTNWTSNNPILLAGEMGIETDTKKFKIGDGTTAWNSLSYGGIQGYTGSIGYTGSASTVIGYTGSLGYTGSIGYTGSASTVIGYTGSLGYTGSQGAGYTGSLGYTGSQGVVGYTGSLGYTGSQGAGYTGSQGVVGYTGSLGYTGSQGAGYTGSQGVIGYTGSKGDIGYTGSSGAYAAIGYTGSAGGAIWQEMTSNFNAVVNYGYFVNTTSGAITATLPGSPTIGQSISFVDGAGTFNTNNLTVSRNGNPIQGDASDLIVSTNRAAFTLVFYNATQGWLLNSK